LGRVFFPAFFRVCFPDLSLFPVWCVSRACGCPVCAVPRVLFSFLFPCFWLISCILFVCVRGLFWLSVFSFFGGVPWLLSCRFFLWLPLSVPLLPSGVRRIFLLIFLVVLCVRLCVLSVCLRLCFGVRSPAWAWVLVVALAVSFRLFLSLLFVSFCLAWLWRGFAWLCFWLAWLSCLLLSVWSPVERGDHTREETKRGWKKKKRTGEYKLK